MVAIFGLRNTWLIEGARISLWFSRGCLRLPDGTFKPFHIKKRKGGHFDHPGGLRGPKFLVVASFGLRNAWLIEGARIFFWFSGGCLRVPFTLRVPFALFI